MVAKLVSFWVVLENLQNLLAFFSEVVDLVLSLVSLVVSIILT